MGCHSTVPPSTALCTVAVVTAAYAWEMQAGSPEFSTLTPHAGHPRFIACLPNLSMFPFFFSFKVNFCLPETEKHKHLSVCTDRCVPILSYPVFCNMCSCVENFTGDDLKFKSPQKQMEPQLLGSESSVGNPQSSERPLQHQRAPTLFCSLL